MTNRLKQERFYTQNHNSLDTLKLNIEQSGSLIFLDNSNNNIEVDLPPADSIASFSINFSFLITNVTNGNTIKINSKDKIGNLESKIKVKSDISSSIFSSYTIVTDLSIRNWIADNFLLVSDGSFWYLTDNTWNEENYALSIISGNTNNFIITSAGNNYSLEGNSNLTFDGANLTIGASLEVSENIINPNGVLSIQDANLLSNTNTFCSNLLTSSFYPNSYSLDSKILINTDLFYLVQKLVISSNGKYVAVKRDVATLDGINSDGLVQVYSFNSNKWTQIGSDIKNPSVEATFGNGLAINKEGNILAIGASQNGGISIDSVTGEVTLLAGNGFINVVEFINGFWTQKGNTISGENGEGIGGSCVLNATGDILASGTALSEETLKIGKVKIYKYNGTEWIQLGNTISGLKLNDSFGYSLDINSNGKVLVVGSPQSTESELIYSNGNFRTFIYSDSTNIWDEMGDPVYGSVSEERSGFRLKLNGDGNILAVGSPGFNSSKGYAKVYYFDNDNNIWIQKGSAINAISTDENIIAFGDDNFGESLDISNDGKVLVVGAPRARYQVPETYIALGSLDPPLPPIPDPTVLESIRGYFKIFYWGTEEWVQQQLIYGDTFRASNRDSNQAQAIYDIFSSLLSILPSLGYEIKITSDSKRIFTVNNIYLSNKLLTSYNEDDISKSIQVYSQNTYKPNVKNCLKNITSTSVEKVFNADESGFHSMGTIRQDDAQNSTFEGEADNDKSGTSISVSGNGTRVAVGSPLNDGGGDGAGNVRVYNWVAVDEEYVKLGDDIDGEAAGDNSGHCVSLSYDGSKVAVGAPYNDGGADNAGHVKIYEYDAVGESWDQLGSDIDGDSADENSGHSISLNRVGTIIAIGSPGHNNNRGRVRIFEYDALGQSWNQKGDDILGDVDGDKCGWSVDLDDSGTIVAIGYPYALANNLNDGVTRVYEFINTSWTLKGSTLFGRDNISYLEGQFGYSVSISGEGTTLAVGAPYYRNYQTNNDIEYGFYVSGVVKLFVFNGISWIEIKNISDPLPGGGDNFGFSVNLNNDTNALIIGRPCIDAKNYNDFFNQNPGGGEGGGGEGEGGGGGEGEGEGGGGGGPGEGEGEGPPGGEGEGPPGGEGEGGGGFGEGGGGEFGGGGEAGEGEGGGGEGELPIVIEIIQAGNVIENDGVVVWVYKDRGTGLEWVELADPGLRNNIIDGGDQDGPNSINLGYSVAISNTENVIGIGYPIQNGAIVVQGTMTESEGNFATLDFSNTGDLFITHRFIESEQYINFINANNVGQQGKIIIYFEEKSGAGTKVTWLNGAPENIIGSNQWITKDTDSDILTERYNVFNYFIVEEGKVLISENDSYLEEL